jgi:glutamate synthase (NADPH/NADH) large chain
VVLGATGRNFAAGMSGGIAYVFDPDGDFVSKCNPAMVALEKILPVAEQAVLVERSLWHALVRDGEGLADEAILKGLIERHFKYTGSTRARNMLDNWADTRSKFVKVFPSEYKRALGELHAAKVVKAELQAVAPKVAA